MKKVKLFTIAALALSAVLLSCSANDEPTDKQSKEIALNIIEQKQKSSSFEKVIGTYDTSGNLIITADTLELKRVFQNQLKRDGINTTLGKIEMKKGTIGGTSKEHYYLLGTSNDGTVKIATSMFPSPTLVRTLVVLMRSNDFLNSTCTCNGCRRGCSPSYFENSDHYFEWECSDCEAGDPNDCRKSVTMSGSD